MGDSEYEKFGFFLSILGIAKDVLFQKYNKAWHDEAINQNKDLYNQELKKSNYMQMLDLQLQHKAHVQSYALDLVSAMRESERDMYEQISARMGYVLVSASIMFGALSTLLFQNQTIMSASEYQGSTAYAMLFLLLIFAGLSFGYFIQCILKCILVVYLMTEYMSRKSKDNVFEVINYMKLFSLMGNKQSSNKDSKTVYDNFLNLDLESQTAGGNSNSNNNNNNSNNSNINSYTNSNNNDSNNTNNTNINTTANLSDKFPEMPRSPPPEKQSYIEKVLDEAALSSKSNKSPEDYLKENEALDAYHASVLRSLDSHSAFLAKLSLGQFVNKSETDKFKTQLNNLNYDNSRSFWDISQGGLANYSSQAAGSQENPGGGDVENNTSVDQKELESFLTFESFRAKKTYYEELYAEKSMKLGTVYLILTSK